MSRKLCSEPPLSNTTAGNLAPEVWDRNWHRRSTRVSHLQVARSWEVLGLGLRCEEKTAGFLGSQTLSSALENPSMFFCRLVADARLA